MPIPSNNRLAILKHPLFLLALTLLILNDSWWKWSFSNTLTGKISDFSGLFAFSIVLFLFLPKRVDRLACWISGLLFILWKSPVATPVLEWINQNPWLHFGRVLDYSDWWALLVLPLAHQLLLNPNTRLGTAKRPIKQQIFERFPKLSFSTPLLHYSILALALIAFSATSLIRYEMPRGDVYMGDTYEVKIPKDSVLAQLEQMGYTYRIDTAYQDTFATNWGDGPLLKTPYYEIESVALTSYDTLANLRFKLYPIKGNQHCRIEVLNITLGRSRPLTNWRQLKQAWKYYRKSIKRNLIKKLD